VVDGVVDHQRLGDVAGIAQADFEIHAFSEKHRWIWQPQFAFQSGSRAEAEIGKRLSMALLQQRAGGVFQ